jgi:UDP-N-acetylmuramate--alanine ligase
VVTNIDREHLDHYADLSDIQDSFHRFLKRVPFYGLSIVCGDDPNVQSVIRRLTKRTLTYGFSRDNQVVADDLRLEGMRCHFQVHHLDEEPVEISLNLPGRHSVLNALAAYAVARELDVSAETIREAMKNFGGVGRRFEIRSEVEGVLHVDDYGHHPTEVTAVLETARSVWNRRLVTLFQPHRYSRTQALAEEFGKALAKTDVLLLAEIYPAGERPLPGVDASLILAAIRAHPGAPKVYSVRDAAEAVRCSRDLLQPGDVLLTLGAGDVYRWGDRIMSERARSSAGRISGDEVGSPVEGEQVRPKERGIRG